MVSGGIFAQLTLHRGVLFSRVPQMQRFIDDGAAIEAGVGGDVRIEGRHKIRVECGAHFHPMTSGRYFGGHYVRQYAR